MEPTEQEKRDVAEILSRIESALALDQQAARTLLHRFVCRGKCEWYRTKSKQAGFCKGGLTEEQNAAIAKAIAAVLPGFRPEHVWYVVHGVLCPGHPRAKPPDMPER